MDTITVNKSEIAKFATVGKKLALNKNAEIELCKLLDLKDYIDGVVDEVKEQIATEAQKKYPDFKGVVGEKIKAIYRAYGDKYISSNEEYTKLIQSRRVDGAKIDAYVGEIGKLPEGVKEKARTLKLIITRL